MKFSLPKGMRDIEPEEMAKREYVLQKIKPVLIKYGFQLVEPSALENLDTLTAKSGPEIEKEIYAFADKSDRKIALRFDLTVGMARLVASTKYPRPLKLACISNMWRYENPQYARYRNFWQWDAEIYGCQGEEADAELIAIICDVLDSFSLDYEIKINNRKLVEGFLLGIGISKQKVPDALRVVDKLKKLTRAQLLEEFKKAGVSAADAKKIFALFEETSLKKIGKMLNNDLAEEGLEEIKSLFQNLDSLGIKKYSLDLSIVRGIDYYTGIVYEAWVKGDESLGAVAGGGRYDDLLGVYGEPMPATGFAGGIERLLLSLPKLSISSAPSVQVIYVNDKVFPEAMRITQEIRKCVSADIDLSRRNLSNQMKYANSRGVPFILVIGEKELAAGSAKLKNMKTGKEKSIFLKKLDEIVSMV